MERDPLDSIRGNKVQVLGIPGSLVPGSQYPGVGLVRGAYAV